MNKIVIALTLAGLALFTVGCNSKDEQVDAAKKLLEESQKQNAKLMDAATDQMKAGTEMMKATTESVKQQTEAVKTEVNTAAAKQMDAANKAMDDTKKSLEKK